MPFFGQVRLTSIFGIPIKLDMSWFIVFVLIAWTLAFSLFPSEYPDLSGVQVWIMGIAGSLLLFASVLIHELCHCYIARQNGISIRGVTLFIFGGVSEMVEEPPNPRAEFLMAAAGPLASIVIAFWTGLLAFAAHALGMSEVIYGVLKYLAIINAVLAAFNLIPGFPLDGGRLLRALLWQTTGSLRNATRIASTVGSVFGVAFVALGVLAIISSRDLWITGLWFVLIGFFLRTAALGSYRQLLLRRALQGVSVSQVMTTNVVTVPAELPVAQLVHDYFMRNRFHSFPVLDGGRLVGLVTLHEVKHVPREQWDKVPVGQIMNTHILSLSVSPDDAAMAAWVRMAAQGVGRVPVVVNGELVGILSQHDLVRFLNIMSDLTKD